MDESGSPSYACCRPRPTPAGRGTPLVSGARREPDPPPADGPLGLPRAARSRVARRGCEQYGSGGPQASARCAGVDGRPRGGGGAPRPRARDGPVLLDLPAEPAGCPAEAGAPPRPLRQSALRSRIARPHSATSIPTGGSSGRCVARLTSPAKTGKGRRVRASPRTHGDPIGGCSPTGRYEAGRVGSVSCRKYAMQIINDILPI